MVRNILTCWNKNYYVKRKSNKQDTKYLPEDSISICNFCTIGSQKYLIKLIAFYNSILKSGCPFHLWILSMDDFTYEVLSELKLECIDIISINILEEDNEILKAKEGKAENEYCWMLKPPLIQYVLLQEDVESVIYLDSDTYFLKDPSQLFDHFKQSSIYLTPQRDTEEIEQKYGRYQAGLIGFKNDEEGMEALNYWKVKCLEWCRHEYDAVNQRYGDQKYLDEIQQRFHLVACEENYGINAAPWNCIYNKERTVDLEDGIPRINGDEIILFHFACITMFNETEFDLWNLDKLEIPKYILSKLYIPYIKELKYAAQVILSVVNDVEYTIFSDNSSNEAKSYFDYNEFSERLMKYGDFYHICSIVSNRYLFRIIALYNSLIQRQDNFNLWLCVIDEEAYEILRKMKLENVTVIHVKDINTDARAKHSTNEFCWVLKSLFIDYLFHNYKLERVLYCDADMYFYLSLKLIYDEWGTYSFFMTTQRSNMYTELRDGQYQAGLLGFKNDSYGMKILTWWKKKCVEWCFDWYDEKMERWGDQKYLDKIPKLFENIKVSYNPGINAAPWNLILNDQGYFVTENNDQVFINNYMICCFHFGSMKIIGPEKFDLWYRCELKMKPEIIKLIYAPYVKILSEIMKDFLTEGYDIRNFICENCEIESKNLFILGEGE